MIKYNKEISAIQKDYLNILMPYKESLNATSDFLMESTLLIEDIKKFWLSQSSYISLMLDSMTKKNCTLLCGAIYLGVEDNEEYIFTTFGYNRFLNDPFIRMEPILLGQTGEITPYAKSYFENAYNDTIAILQSFSNEITFVPMQLLYNRQIKDHKDTISHGYWGVISSLLKGDFSSAEDLKSSFPDCASIEKSLSEESLTHLIFLDPSDIEITLSQRINKYFQENSAMLPIDYDDEIDKFIFATYAQITQVLDILLMCLYFNVIPFIRYEITFHYLILLSGSFREQKEISTVIIKTIIIYLFYHNIDRRIFDSIVFTDYSEHMKHNDLLEKVISRITSNGESFFAKKVDEIVSIIQEEFDKCIQDL